MTVADDRRQALGLVPPLEERRAEMHVVDVKRAALGGDVHTRFSDDELLTNAMLYWVTETIGSSFLTYYDLTHAGAMRWIVEKAKDWVGSSEVPTGFAQFPWDIGHPLREWIERFHDRQRYTEMPRGRHFAALEEPELLADDLRAFFRPLRSA